MKSSGFVQVTLLAIAMGLATWVVGWWGVPVVAGLYVFAGPAKDQASRAAMAAALAWSALLMFDASRSALPYFAGTLQALLGKLAPALLLATVIFPALLAWSAAALVVELMSYSREPFVARAPRG